MTTPPARPPWLWILTEDQQLVRPDQIIAIEADSENNGQAAVNAMVAVPNPGSTYSASGPVRFPLTYARSRDDAERTAAKLLQFVGEHLAAGHAGVVAWHGKGLELTQWHQA